MKTYCGGLLPEAHVDIAEVGDRATEVGLEREAERGGGDGGVVGGGEGEHGRGHRGTWGMGTGRKTKGALI